MIEKPYLGGGIFLGFQIYFSKIVDGGIIEWKIPSKISKYRILTHIPYYFGQESIRRIFFNPWGKMTRGGAGRKIEILS